MPESVQSPLFSALTGLCRRQGRTQRPEEREVLKLLIVTLVPALLAWLSVLWSAPAISLDTTVYYLEQGNGEILHVIRTGRFMQALLLYLFPPLASTPAVTGLLLLAQLVACGLLFVLLLTPVPRLRVQEYLAAAVCVLFPYWQNFFYITFAHVGYGLSILLPLVALVAICRLPGLAGMGLAGILTGLSLGFYQSSLHVYFCVLCMAAALRTVQGAGIRQQVRLLLRGTAAAAGGALLYLCLHKAAMYLAGLQGLDTGGYSVSFAFSLTRFLENIPLQLSGNAVLLPAWQSNLLYIVGGLSWLLSYRAGTAGRHLFLLLCLAGALLANIGLSLVTPQGLAVRTTIGLAYFWGGVALLTGHVPWQRIRRLLHGVLAVLLLCFVFNSAASWRILNEISDWDRIQAMQIKHDLLRFAAARNLSAPYSVSLIGCIGREELPWPQDWLSVTGYSMLSCFGSATVGHHPFGLFQRTGARDFDFRPVRASDFRRVQGRAPWPAEEGIFEDAEGLAIWLGPARRPQGPDESLVALARSMGVRDARLSAGPGRQHPCHDWLLREAARNPQGPWTLPPGAVETIFGIDGTEDLPEDSRYARVTGWVYDLLHCTRPDMIFFLDDSGRVAGFGHSGIRREELGSRVAARAVFGGFSGYILRGSRIARIVYFLDYSHLCPGPEAKITPMTSAGK